MFLLSCLTYISGSGYFYPSTTPCALHGLWRRKLRELFLRGELGKSERGVPGIRLGCSVDSCGICPSRSLRILGTGTETEKQRLQKLGGSWEGCPGEYQEKAPEVDKRQSRAGEGGGGTSGGGGASGLGADGGNLLC